MKIALFVTCLADVLYPPVGQATAAVLERLGHTVVFPADQTCCGQMHTNTGYERDACVLVRHHVEVFERALIDGADAARFLRWIAEAFEQPFLLSVQG